MRRLRTIAAVLCASAAAAMVLAWFVGRIATDRWMATQLVFWIPSVAVIAPAAVLAIAGLLVAPRAGRAEAGAPGRRTRWPRRLALASCGLSAAAACWLVLGVWRLPRLAAMPARPPAAQSLRIVHWNACSVDRSFTDDTLALIPHARETDVFLLTCLISTARVSSAAARLGPEYGVSRLGPFAIVSRVPVLRASLSSLSLPTPDSLATANGAPRSLYGHPLVQRIYNRLSRALGVRRRSLERAEPGLVAFVELDTTASLGRPITAWFIDLPSSPLSPRFALATAAAEHLAVLRSSGALPAGPSGHPDLLVGDFNIPRGSASLDRIGRAVGGDMTHAFDQAGYGPAASWPRQRPLLPIDNLFTAAPLRAARYELIDPGVSEHRAQSAELTIDQAP